MHNNATFNAYLKRTAMTGQLNNETPKAATATDNATQQDSVATVNNDNLLPGGLSGFYIRRPAAPLAAFKFLGEGSLPPWFINLKSWKKDRCGGLLVSYFKGGDIYLPLGYWAVLRSDGKFDVYDEYSFNENFLFVVPIPDQK